MIRARGGGGGQTAPGRGCECLAAQAEARRPEEAQSGAYAPPQGHRTRPPPIIRGPSRQLPTTRTLTRVGGGGAAGLTSTYLGFLLQYVIESWKP